MASNDDIDYKAAFERACIVLEALDYVCRDHKCKTADDYKKEIIKTVKNKKTTGV